MKRTLLALALALSVASMGAHAVDDLDTIAKPVVQPQVMLPPGMAFMVAMMTQMRARCGGNCSSGTCPTR